MRLREERSWYQEEMHLLFLCNEFVFVAFYSETGEGETGQLNISGKSLRNWFDNIRNVVYIIW